MAQTQGVRKGSGRGVKNLPDIDYAVPQVFHKPEGFERYIAGYPDTSGLLAYVYRLSPKIDFSLIGIRETYILKTANVAEMNQAFIASKFGRGHYMLKLTDSNRPNGQRQVAQTWFM